MYGTRDIDIIEWEPAEASILLLTLRGRLKCHMPRDGWREGEREKISMLFLGFFIVASYMGEPDENQGPRYFASYSNLCQIIVTEEIAVPETSDFRKKNWRS